MNKRIPQNPKYKHVSATVDTGLSISPISMFWSDSYFSSGLTVSTISSCAIQGNYLSFLFHLLSFWSHILHTCKKGCIVFLNSSIAEARDRALNFSKGGYHLEVHDVGTESSIFPGQLMTPSSMFHYMPPQKCFINIMECKLYYHQIDLIILYKSTTVKINGAIMAFHWSHILIKIKSYVSSFSFQD